MQGMDTQQRNSEDAFADFEKTPSQMNNKLAAPGEKRKLRFQGNYVE